VFSPRAKLLLHRGESGPGGIRTRICDLDRVLCYRCTTGPERSLRDDAEDSKNLIGNFVARVPNWDGLGFGRFENPPFEKREGWATRPQSR
jgi:hypothetical protein